MSVPRRVRTWRRRMLPWGRRWSSWRRRPSIWHPCWAAMNLCAPAWPLRPPTSCILLITAATTTSTSLYHTTDGRRSAANWTDDWPQRRVNDWTRVCKSFKTDRGVTGKANMFAKQWQYGTQTVTYSVENYLFCISCSSICFYLIKISDLYVNLNGLMSRIINQSMFTLGEITNLLYVEVTQMIFLKIACY